MNPAELATLRARYPALQGLGEAQVADYFTNPSRTSPPAAGRADKGVTPSLLSDQASGSPLQAFRQKYPEYDGLPDQELADRLYSRFYAGSMDRSEYDARLGLTAAGTAPSYEALMDAARRADAAGDAAGAKRLLELAQAAKARGNSNTTQTSAKPNIEVSLPDGSVVEFPQGTDDATMTAAIKDYLATLPQENVQPKGRTGIFDDLIPPQDGPWTKYAETQETAPEGPWTKYATKPSSGLFDDLIPKSNPGLIGGTSAAATDGFLFGFGDEYLAGLSALLGVQPDGQGGANWFEYDKPIADRYSTALGAIRQEQADFREAEPTAAITGEVLGALIGPGKGAGGFINAGAGTAARIGRGALAGATSAAAYGFGEGEGSTANRALSAASAAPVGAIGGGAITALGQGLKAGLNAVMRRPELKEIAPTLASLRTAATDLYEQARLMGGQLPADRLKAMTQGITTRVNEAGYDSQLHPRVAAVLARLNSETGPKSLQEMEILRRVATNAAASLQPDERRIAMEVVDAIDDAVEGIGGGSAALKEARAVWAQLRRMETIDDAISRASLTDNFAAGLRAQFKALLRNPRRLRGFTDAQIKAIRDVAKGGPLTNSLRALGNLLAPTGISGAALTGGAFMSGAGFGSLAIPVAGSGISRMAGAMTEAAANRALRAAGQSPDAQALATRLLMGPNILAPTVPAAGLLGPGYAAQLSSQ